MWTTTDGYVLHLPRSGLMKILARLQDSGLNELIKDHHTQNLTREVVHLRGRLAQNARRDGSVLHRQSQQRYAIFSSRAGGGKYQLLARPLRPGKARFSSSTLRRRKRRKVLPRETKPKF
jgi:hypothetical protein